MDIDKLILVGVAGGTPARFGSLMDIDKLILNTEGDITLTQFWFSDGY